MRLSGRGAWVIACAGAALALAAAGGWAWLRSHAGERYVRARLQAVAEAHLDARLTVARVHGSLLGDVTLEDVVLKDARGRAVLEARAAHARYGLWGLLRGRPRLERVLLDGLEADLDELARDRVRLGEAVARAAGSLDEVHLAELVVDDAKLSYRGHVLRRAQGRARLWVGQGGRRGVVVVQGLRGRLALDGVDGTRGVGLTGSGRWSAGPDVDVDDVEVVLGKSRLAARGRLGGGRLDLEVRELLVEPGDLRWAVPLEDPPAAISGRLSAHGPLDAVVTKIHLRPGDGTVRFDGVVDLPARRARAVVDHHALDGGFFPTRPPFLFNGRVRLDCRLAGGGIVGPVEVEDASGAVLNVVVEDVSANARFVGGGVDFGRAALALPGGTVTGRARVRFSGDVEAQFRVRVTDLGKLLAVARGKVPLPDAKDDRGVFTLEGSLTKKKGEKPETDVRALKLGSSSDGSRRGRSYVLRGGK